ncbi:MAG TPA: aromatic amino acid transport family protein [Rhabdochlamydiaceae bacterium]|jgi:tyrosine-specific transport protein
MNAVLGRERGSVFGGMLLIVGSCIGVGMLGLPIVAGLSGFFPSLVMLILAWLFMTTSALLLVEVNGWFSTRVNFVTMTGQTLGQVGKGICTLTYISLFYAVLVAYISGIGNLSTSFFQRAFGIALPMWIGCLFFVLLFGWVIYLGTRRVDLCNRALMVGKIAFFILLVLAGVFFIQPALLLQSAPKYVGLSLPLLVISFGFHNMIPSLVFYLQGDLKRTRIAILGGSLFVFVIYLIWEILVLGIVPIGGPGGLIDSLIKDREASQALTAIVGSPWISIFSQGLAFFAILTSFIAQALSLVHFLADGMKIPYKKKENPYLCVLVLVPPLVCTLVYPQLFFKALNFAGGICTVILFGILPVAMVWVGRYRKKTRASYEVPGGKMTLGVVFLFALLILFLQLASMCGASFIPSLK